MHDTDKADPKAQELDEQALDQASAGTAPKPSSQPKPSGGGNVTGLDDWEKHNV